MAATQTRYEHVELNQNAQAIIAGTTFKIVELIEEKIADGASAEDLHLQHQQFNTWTNPFGSCLLLRSQNRD